MRILQFSNGQVEEEGVGDVEEGDAEDDDVDAAVGPSAEQDRLAQTPWRISCSPRSRHSGAAAAGNGALEDDGKDDEEGAAGGGDGCGNAGGAVWL